LREAVVLEAAIAEGCIETGLAPDAAGEIVISTGPAEWGVVARGFRYSSGDASNFLAQPAQQK
jgi:hypothetical protein